MTSVVPLSHLPVHANTTTQPFRIAQDGKALVKIVVDSKNSTKEELQAAKDLSDYLGRVTGGKFDIVEEKELPLDTPAIYVGNTAFADSSGIHCKSMAPQHGRIVTRAGGLVIAGGRPAGTQLVGFYFLEQYVGCRWYTVFDEAIPSKPNISVPALDVNYSPAFKFRTIYRQGGHHRGPYGGEQEWCLRNRSVAEEVGRPPGGSTCHTYSAYFNPKDYFDNHPEYASFMNGKYNLELHDQFCQTNPDVRKIVLEKLRKVIRDNPNADYYEVSTNDGNRQRCQCPGCMEIEKQEGRTGPFMDFINFLADGIKDEFPKAIIRTFAYNVTALPTKTMKYRPNVCVRVCITGTEHLPFTAPENAFALRDVQAWRERATRLFKWDYDGLAHGQVFPAPIFDSYTDRLNLYPKLNIEGLFLESELMVSPRPFVGMRHWVWLHKAEDPSRDVWELVQDFSNGMYGKAAPHIMSLLKLTEKRKQDYPYNLYDFSYLTGAQGLFDKAEKAVADSPKALARVREARLGLDLATLYYWTKAITDHVRSGGKESDWKLNKDTIIARVEPLLLAVQKEGRWLSCGVPHWNAQQKQQAEEKWLTKFQQTVVQPVVNCGRAAKNVMPLPPELETVPADRIVDLPAPVIGFCDGRGPFYEQVDDRIPVPDPQSTAGNAVFISNERMKAFGGVLPFHLGIYDSTGRVGGGARVNPDDIKGEGYRLYKMGRFRLSDTAYIYLTGSWQIQIRPLIPFLNPDNPDHPWDIYLSLKTSGPGLPFGDKTGKDGIFLDRMILVRVDEERKLTRGEVRAAEKGENLLASGDFDRNEKPDPKTGLPRGLRVSAGEGATVALDAETKASGTHSLRITRSGDAGAATVSFADPVPVVPGATYLLSAKVMFTDRHISFAFGCLDEKKNGLPHQPDNLVKMEPVTRYLGIGSTYFNVPYACQEKPNSFNPIEMALVIPAQAHYLNVSLGYGHAIGAAWFDDVQVRQILA